MKSVLLCLLVIAAFAQVDLGTTCQSDSYIDKLATGTINLNPLDTYNNGANKDYYQDLTRNNFDTIDVLGYGFALSGFQTGCSNDFYTLIIDKVEFLNQNTRMRIVVNFRNPSDGAITRWNMVTFTYIVVSRYLSGTFSDIWVTIAETIGATATIPVASAPNAGQAYDTIGAAYQTTPTGACQIYSDPNYAFNPAGCPTGTVASADGLTGGGDNIMHAYIMGFMWNPAVTTTHYLYAGTISTGPNTFPFTTSAAALNAEDSPVLSFVTPFGPSVYLHNVDNALIYMKIAFVHSRFDSGKVSTGYPSTISPAPASALIYSSSYIFTQVTTFNTAIAAVKQASIGTIEYNNYYYHLVDARYAIYGITMFDLPKTNDTSCATILLNATLNNIDTFTVTTPNDNPTDVFFAADIFTVNTDTLCVQTDVDFQTEIVTVGKKDYFTIPTLSNQQFAREGLIGISPVGFAAAPATTVGTPLYTLKSTGFYFSNYAVNNGNNDTVFFKTEVPFLSLTAGAPLKFEFAFFDKIAPHSGVAAEAMRADTEYEIKLEVNGYTLYYTKYTPDSSDADNTPGGVIVRSLRGLNSPGTTATAVITVSYIRSTAANQNVWTYIHLTQYSNAYDPTTGCCPTACPSLTGVDVQINPPVCVYCNTQAGLVYNPNNGTCTCKSGFYLDTTKTFQCYPCEALYCDICDATDSSKCTTCVTGAYLDNVTLTCTCGNGYFVNGTTCQQCPYPCQNCSSPSGTCTACVDATHRDITQNCQCITGFYDVVGQANCSTCSPTCLTCTNNSACVSCDASAHRTLNGGVCACTDGYYEFYHTNLTRTCEKCSAECHTCTTSPTLCTSCDASKNRISGMDANGRMTCICQPGYYSTADGSCVQSDCNADPFCAECETGLKLCIKCLASKFRVIKQPENICVCMDGYYANQDNICVPCKSGCGVCSSATNCTSCVALSTSNNDGSCSCPSTTYFTVSADGVRYCAACGVNCLTCVDENTCTTCQTSYTKTADNKCICAARHFIDTNGDCIPCANGCDKCSSASVCESCISPLLLQGNTCQLSCNNGFTAIGSVCQGCSTGCQRCTQNLICYYCADGYYSYKGNCYAVCPAGTIGDRSSGNWECKPCNSPCKTCINHPSYCTSCLNGMGYLQTSAVAQSCVLSCVDGTYAENGVCQVCDFRCATCLGSATNCISCPEGQVLYQGGCWSSCPAISVQRVGQNASCTDTCPDGFYKRSSTECSPCAIECTTCEGGPTNCTSCLHGSVSVNGSCTVQCGENEFNFQGYCLACSESCYGCQYSPQNCINCADGYVKTGSICQKGCLSHQYYDETQRKCLTCSSECATCSSYTHCTSCKNADITPRGGVCSNCPYPCATCDGTGACTSCLSGFYYFQGSCRTSCPYGATPINGVCRCQSGIVSLGQCVTSCGSGFTAIDGTCQPCNPNCAECSGTVNYCTKCISGFHINTNTHRCVSQASCAYGQQFLNGVCTNICDSGFYFYQGICIYGGCFSGYAPNSVGGCVRQTTVSSTVSCNSNQYISNGVCVGSCSNGYYPDYTSRQCLPCKARCQSCFSSSYCVICQSGYEAVNGACVQSTDCANYSYNGNCVASCPVGTYGEGSKCVRICPDGNYISKGFCTYTCSTRYRTADACVDQCPSGTTVVNGICQ